MPKTNSANQYASLRLPQQGFVEPDVGNGADCGESRSSFQRCWLPVSRIRGAWHGCRESTALQNCWVWVKWVVTLPILDKTEYAAAKAVGVEKVFAEVDTDRSGTINTEEYAAVLEADCE
ncbi:hypothetical protein A3196_08500 [Candidatus Thiodiazotropha endoloripes]|uniref:EF-hand domain-containing protein n=1 Tax=Candidatus Thiodiazotropha endoloripes TaxID=1818881 RepID=A0A1E2UPV7_9GAMM|nr:hypothetical protein A3196_08500 [Candidatus Thiodiazotropha endoloripes]